MLSFTQERREALALLNLDSLCVPAPRLSEKADEGERVRESARAGKRQRGGRLELRPDVPVLFDEKAIVNT